MLKYMKRTKNLPPARTRAALPLGSGQGERERKERKEKKEISLDLSSC